MAAKQRTPVRERLIQAARELFVERGFDRVSLVEIAKRAECSRSGVNVHFKNKDELFHTVTRRELVDLDKTVPEPTGDLEADLIALARNYYAFYSERPFLFLGLLECSRDAELRNMMLELQAFTISKLTFLYGYYRDKDWWEPSLREVQLEDINEAISLPFLGGMFTQLFFSFIYLADGGNFDPETYVRRFLTGYMNPSKRD